MTTPFGSSDVFAIERPSQSLLTYYLVSSLLWGPLLVFILPYRLARYRTLRYRFDGEGISMSWGVLFRREIHLTYSRIQDIHLTSGIVERYLGLARIQIQTASGKAGAEMTIEGVERFEEVRDFLYSKMRGLRKVGAGTTHDTAPAMDREPAPATSGETDFGPMLAELAITLRELRALLEGQAGRPGTDDADA